MSDEQNWKFDTSDVGETQQTGTDDSVKEESSEQTETIQVDNSSQNRLIISIVSFFLLPISTISVYTVLEEGAVLSMLTGILGNSTVALVSTKAFWIIGLGILGFLSATVVIIVVNILLVATSRASKTNYTIALLGTKFYILATAITATVFSTLPSLVGFVLAVHLISVLATVALMLISGIYGTVMA